VSDVAQQPEIQQRRRTEPAAIDRSHVAQPGALPGQRFEAVGVRFFILEQGAVGERVAQKEHDEIVVGQVLRLARKAHAIRIDTALGVRDHPVIHGQVVDLGNLADDNPVEGPR
jgi:hypothetical protein